MKRQLETKLKIGDLPVGFVGGGGPCTSTQTLGPVGSEFDYSPTCSPINKKLKESSTLSGTGWILKKFLITSDNILVSYGSIPFQGKSNASLILSLFY